MISPELERFGTALFDMDGVVLDTEGQYSMFWERLEVLMDLPKGFSSKVKGMTLDHIIPMMPNPESQAPELIRQLDILESEMPFYYIPGAFEYLTDLRKRGVRTALVTSSNDKKMSNVHRVHPEFKGLFDVILTAESFKASKPAPDCYLQAAAALGSEISDCVVFEDSFNGIKSGKSAGMTVVGLATTNPAESIAPLCDAVISDFTSI